MYFFGFTLLMIPVLWIWAIVLLRRWQHVLAFSLLSAFAVFIYGFVMIFSPVRFFEHDEYGLKKVFLFIFTLMGHTALNFIFALVYKFKLSKKWEQTAKS